MNDSLPANPSNPTATNPESTLARIARVRRTLRLGVYETEDKLERMLGRLASVLLPSSRKPRFKISR